MKVAVVGLSGGKQTFGIKFSFGIYRRRKGMKYAIMSDVHANPVALETALADARALGCTKFVMLGDITGYGYDAKRALGIVRENFDIVLRGNHDSACLGMETSPGDIVCASYDLDRKCRGALADDDVKWMWERRLFCVADGMAFVHYSMLFNGEEPC